jgi:hypothetical protein
VQCCGMAGLTTPRRMARGRVAFPGCIAEARSFLFERRGFLPHAWSLPLKDSFRSVAYRVETCLDIGFRVATAPLSR